jgi:cyclophilin family peptidyl-prolyl cis-trans isomerase
MSETFQVKLETTQGDVLLRVEKSWAPLGVERFRALVESGFYDGAKFFRVVPGFVVQFGLPADAAANAGEATASIKDDPVTQSNTRGRLTFATAGPNTRTSQLFINLGANTFLDNQGFAPFAEVVEGMDVVDKLFSGYGERPNQGQIRVNGNKYLDASFPKLDGITKATIIE